MDLLEQARQRLEGMELPAISREHPPAPGLSDEFAPVPEPTSVSESIGAALSKSWLFQVPKTLMEQDVYHAPDDEDLTQYPELLEGIPIEDHPKVLGQLSKAAAEAMGDDIRERLEVERTQFANGVFIGMASEIASYFDPVSVVTGGTAIKAVMKIPKAARLAKTAQRVAGAASVGGVTAIEERIRQVGHESADEDDVIYAAAAGMAMGGLLGPLMARRGDAAEFAKYADDKGKDLGKAVQDTLDEAQVLYPERDTKPMTVSDELYDIAGEGIEVTEDLKKANSSRTITKNFTEAEHQMAARADELVANGEVGDSKQLSMMKTLLDRNPMMTDGFRLALSKSPMAKVFSAHIGEIATGARGKVATSSALHKLMFERRVLAPVNAILRNSQVEFLSRQGIKQRNFIKYNGVGKVMFDEAVMTEMGRRYAGKPLQGVIDDAVKKAADALDEAYQRGLKELQDVAWKGANEVKWKSGYVPLVWRGAAIAELKQAGKIDDVHKVLEMAYAGVGMSDELSKRLAEAVINRNLASAADWEFNPAVLFSKSSLGELDRMLIDGGVTDMARRGIMKVLEGNTAGMPKRTNIDITVEYNGVRVLDLMSTDVGNITSRWAQRTGGQVGFAKKGIKSFESIESIKKIIRSQAKQAGEDADKIGKSTDAIVDQMLARPVNGGVSRNVRRVLDWSMLTKLGQLVFPQIAEMGNIAGAHGMFQAITSIPVANKIHRQLIKATKTGRFDDVDKPWMAELQVVGGQMHDEHLLYRPNVRLDESVDTGWWAAFDNVSALAQDTLGAVSGMYKVKGVEQVMVTMLQAEKVVKAMKGKLTKANLGRLTDLGWGDETVARIKKQVDAHATFDRGVLDRLHLDKWDDVAKAEFLQGIHRHVNQVIQLPMVGESSYWMHSDVAALLLQFRSYPMLAIEKQTGRQIMAGDLQSGLALMYGAGWAGVASMMKTYTNALGKSGEQRKEYLEKRMTPEALVMQALNYTPAASLAGEGVGVLSTVAGMPLGSIRGGGDALMPPALSGINRAVRGATNITAGLNPLSDTTISERGVRNFISAVPLGNIPQASIITNNVLRGME